MPALQIISLDTTTPRLRAPGSGDTYSAPRAVDITPESLTGSAATSSLSITQTWNTTGTPTAIDLNVTDTASNAASLLMNLRVGGTSRFSVSKGGVVSSAVTSGDGFFLPGASGSFGVDSTRPAIFFLGTSYLRFSSNQVQTSQSYALGAISTSMDVIIARDAANVLALRNGVNAQAFNIYNTYTDASNYERGFVRWSTNVLTIGTERAGTGVERDLLLLAPSTVGATLRGGVAFVDATNTTLNLQRAGITRFQINTSNNIVLTPSTVVAFAGTTSSFPALKRNGTTLETKLADDSAYAPHAAEWLSVTDGVTAPGAATGRARIYVDSADGDLKVVFADGTVKTIVTDT